MLIATRYSVKEHPIAWSIKDKGISRVNLSSPMNLASQVNLMNLLNLNLNNKGENENEKFDSIAHISWIMSTNCNN